MLKVKYYYTWYSLTRNGTPIFVVALLVFCLQFCQVMTTANEGSLVMFVETRFTCENGTSIRGRHVCNGIGDCPNDEDELGCGHPCGPGEFQCSGHGTKACIPKKFHCDGTIDCYDKTDEVDCPGGVNAGSPTGIINMNESETYNTSCFVYGDPIPEIVWNRGGVPVPSKCTSTRIKREGILSCPNLEMADAGVYKCEGINAKKFTVYARAEHPYVSLYVRPKKHEVSCRPDEFQCTSNGACIPEEFRCDGKFNCDDKTDEDGCPEK